MGYPNYEVAQAFQYHLLADYLATDHDLASTTLLTNLRKALSTQNVAGFVAILQAVFATIPHHLFLPQEAYYHSVVYLILNLLGFRVYAERLTNLGRMDAVLETADTVYILEFKMTTAESAIQQIRTKQYAQSYYGRGKMIILLGVAFDPEKRNIVDWAIEQVEA